MALTGGTGGAAVATALVDALTRGVDGVNPATVHIWFGDERFVDATDPERNDLLATGLLDAGVRTVRFHTLAGPDEVADVGVAARLLAREFHEFGPDDGRFDVVHLGVGPDAHVCSLFPGHPAALTIDADIVSVDDSPKPPSRRVTFTFPVLQRARRLMLIAAGSSKAQAVRAGLADPDPVGAPASCARAQRTTWYVDEAALAGS